MINFIVCEDNDGFLKKNINTINKLMFSNDIEYKIHTFKNLSEELINIINNDESNKIYLLDIELEDCSGIDIARKIRKNDWKSIIVFSTAHSELFQKVFSDKLMIFDYISKFDEYEENLYDTLEKTLNIINTTNELNFKIQSNYYNVSLNSILYLMYDKYSRKTIIKTVTDEYFVNTTLTSFNSKLNNDFIKINRACIINKNNVKCFDIKNKNIEFLNGEILDNILINKESVSHE